MERRDDKGSRQRANGILQNELYAGKIIWNRVRMVKDPDTDRRVSRPNPESEWLSAEALHLRILDDETLAAVRAKRGARCGEAPAKSRRPKRLLSGLLKCGCCGAGMAIHDRDKTGKTRVRCSAFRESRSCSHARLYYLEDIERVTVEGLRAELRDPRMIAEFAKIYHAERSKLAHEAVVARANTERRRNETTRSLKRLVDALADESANIGAIRNRLLDLEGERARIEAELADMPEPIDATALHPMAIARYLEQIDQLSAALKSGRDIMAGSSADSFRALVNAVIVHPVAPRTPLDIELRGYLAELTAEPKFRPHGRHSGVTVVAEARYSHSPPPEIAEFPLRLQGAFVRPNAI